MKRLICGSAAFLIAALGGCAGEPKLELLPVVITPEPPPIPRECRAAARKKFPRLAVPDDQSVLPNTALESRWLDARHVNRDNLDLTIVCECFLVDVIGTEADKIEAKPQCTALRTGAPS
jgi:hypothetical protein